jgi:hypothetical protein
MHLNQTLSIIRQMPEFSGQCLNRARLPKSARAAAASVATRSPADLASRDAPFLIFKGGERGPEKNVPEQDLFFGSRCRTDDTRGFHAADRTKNPPGRRAEAIVFRLRFLKKRPQAFAGLDAGEFDRHAFREVTHHAAVQMVEQNGHADRRAHVDIDGGT